MSTLQPKPQPDAISYGSDSLELTERYTRASYREKVGKQAPTFDGRKLMKRWYAVSSSPLTLSHWDTSGPGEPIYVSKSYSVAELAAVNLPGNFEWPKWVPAPSGAFTLEGPMLTRVPINANALATMAQASAIVNDLRQAGWTVSEPMENGEGGVFTIQYDPEEKRRLLNINVSGAVRTVGLMLEERNRAGVASPGRWAGPNENNSPVWISSVAQSSEFGVGEEPIPQRPLLNNEKWVADIFSGWKIVRTDKVTPGSGGGTSPDVSAALANLDTKSDEIKAGIGQILGILGVG